MNQTTAGLACAIALFAGCGDSDTQSDADADTDSDTDTGSDTATESGTDTGAERFTLTIDPSGPGTGSVRSDGGEIDCGAGATCAADFDAGTEVVLTATADDGFVFHGWTGACSGGEPCTVALFADATVGAGFVPILYQTSRARDGSDALDPDGLWSVWTVKTDGTDDAPLPGLADDTSYYAGSWSPSADRIAMVAVPPGATWGRVEIANADGSDAVPLHDVLVAGTWSPVWTSDGTRLFFESNAAFDGSDVAQPFSNIWTANADGSGLAPVTRFEATSAIHPHVSPDGTKLLYASYAALDGSDVESPARNLWVSNADGTDAVPLTHYTADVNCFPLESGGWSPDGSEIVYISSGELDGSDARSLDEAFNVWLISADGSEMRALTSYTVGAVNAATPRWSADGTRIVFQSSGMLDGSDAAIPNGGNNLWVVTADGSGLEPLTHNTAAEHRNGFWSADGSILVHETDLTLDGGLGLNDNATKNVWISNAGGRDAAPVTQLRGVDVYAGLPML